VSRASYKSKRVRQLNLELRTSKLTLEEMDVQFGDQLVDHVLQHPDKAEISHVENTVATREAQV
jgi:hypothetical protein